MKNNPDKGNSNWKGTEVRMRLEFSCSKNWQKVNEARMDQIRGELHKLRIELGWMSVSPEIHVKILTSNVTVLGGENFGKCYILRVEPSWMGREPLQKRHQRARRQMSVNQEAGSPRHWTCQHHELGLPSLQNVQKKCLLIISHSVKGIFCYSGQSGLRQPGKILLLFHW